MEYLISKLSFENSRQLIDNVIAHSWDGKIFTDLGQKDRNWLVSIISNGHDIYSIDKNSYGKWFKRKKFFYNRNIFTWNNSIPKNITKRKTFISYYHNEDQQYKEKFKNMFEDLIISKSVEKDDIDSDNSDEYIKQLIQKDYLTDTTVLVVLVGPKTKCRKHIDWEISGAISTKVGGNSGLLGILLPSHPDYGKQEYHATNLPPRLAANVESGYAILHDWTSDRVQMQKWIEEAFAKKSDIDTRITTSIPQMDKDICE